MFVTEELRIWALSDVFFDQHGVPEWLGSPVMQPQPDPSMQLAACIFEDL